MKAKLSEVQAMIAGAVARHGDNRKALRSELKAIQWRLRGPRGEFVGLGSVIDGLPRKFVPESEALIFDGRDNEEMKLQTYERTLGPLTIEILPQIVCAS